jgi:hypothetical protein
LNDDGQINMKGRKLRCRCLAALLLLTIRSTTLFAADVFVRVVDPLGRPLSNAVVDIYWLQSFSEKDIRRIGLAKLASDRNGTIQGRYDGIAIPRGEDIWVDVSKDGYSGYSTTGLRPEFVLAREFKAADVRRIAALSGGAQVNEVRELLAGAFDDAGGGLSEVIFVQEHRFRVSLRELVHDPKVGTEAAQMLAFIGVPDDVRLVVDNAPLPKQESFENRWAYGVVCSLLEPTTEKEWAFLQTCATNSYDDLWVDAGAIRTLKLIASPRSKQVLHAVAAVNEGRANEVEQAIRYIDSAPASLDDEDLIAAGNKVAQAIRIGKWQGNKKPRFNEKEDKALVDCEFIAGRDLLVQTATFQKVDGIWKFRGSRETKQALLARQPESDGAKDQKK